MLKVKLQKENKITKIMDNKGNKFLV